MADKRDSHPLAEHREELANTLDPHVDSLVQKFSELQLLSDENTAILEDKPKNQRISLLLDIIHGEVEKHNSQIYDQLITFMRSAQEYTSLTTLADKMVDSEEVPVTQPVQTESSTQVVQGLYMCTIILCMCMHSYAFL